jgi:hypothetical protein
MTTNLIIFGVLLLLGITLLILIVRENIKYWKAEMNSNVRYKTRLGGGFNIYEDEY